MANVRTYVFLLLLVNYRLALSQPTFGSAIFCGLFCADSDDDSGDDEYDFYDLFGVCSACGGTKEPAAEAATTPKAETVAPIKIMIPPANGVNVTLLGTIGGLLLDLVPWAASPTTAAPASAAPTTAAPATTAAGSTAATTAAASTTVKK